jgi:hypothetical protein
MQDKSTPPAKIGLEANQRKDSTTEGKKRREAPGKTSKYRSSLTAD